MKRTKSLETVAARVNWARTVPRVEPSISTRELDRMAGLSEGHTSMIESGKRDQIDMKTATALASVFCCTLDWLVAGKGFPPSVEEITQNVVRLRSRA